MSPTLFKAPYGVSDMRLPHAIIATVQSTANAELFGTPLAFQNHEKSTPLGWTEPACGREHDVKRIGFVK
jgi:hypothetical protein